MSGSGGLAYRSRCAAAGSGPRGSDTSPCGPAAGSRSSSPGCRWREKTAGERTSVNARWIRRSVVKLTVPRPLSPVPPPHLLLRQQVFGQLVLVSEAAQRVHALQDVGVNLLSQGQRPDGHLPGDGLLGFRLVLSGPATQPGRDAAR